MRGFGHYDRELKDVDREIDRYAAIFDVNTGNCHEVDACMRKHRDSYDDKVGQFLPGLLILHIKLETAMAKLVFYRQCWSRLNLPGA